MAKNVTTEIKGNILTIKVDISKSLGSSKSGKSVTVATTEGNMSIEGTDLKLGLNIYRKKEDEKEEATA